MQKLLDAGEDAGSPVLLSVEGTTAWPAVFGASMAALTAKAREGVPSSLGGSGRESFTGTPRHGAPSVPGTPKRTGRLSALGPGEGLPSARHPTAAPHAHPGATPASDNSLVVAMETLFRTPAPPVLFLELNVDTACRQAPGSWRFYQLSVPAAEPRAQVHIECTLACPGRSPPPPLSLFISSRRRPTAVEHDWRAPQVASFMC